VTAAIIRAWKGITVTVSESAVPSVPAIYTVKTNRSKIPLYQGPDSSRADDTYEEAVRAAPPKL
jgi:hypothetical protein